MVLSPRFNKIVAIVAGLSVAIVGYAVYVTIASTEAPTPTPAATTTCTVTDKLVNPCRPWLGAFGRHYPQVASDLKSQILYHEKRVGRQGDIVRGEYHVNDQTKLLTSELYFINRPNTYLLFNWKPDSGSWAKAGGSNDAVNSRIDRMADELKTVAPKKVMLDIHHEAENDVTPGSDPKCPQSSFYSSSSSNSGSPAEFRAMFRNVHARFTARGVKNVVYVFNPMGYKPFNCLVNSLYPGNDVTDWIMFDIYGNNANKTWQTSVGPFYNWLTANSNASHDYLSKPWGSAEFSIHQESNATGDKVVTKAETYAYYDSIKTSLESKTYPRIKAYIPFDSSAGRPDNRSSYDNEGAYDPTEQAYYNAFANSPVFKDSTTPPADTTAPSVPTGLGTPTQTTSSIALTWDASTDNIQVTGYRVYRGGTLVASPTTTSYTDSGLTANTSYNYTVKAVDAAGNISAASDVLNVRTKAVGDATPPTVPANLTSPSQTTSSIKLSWAASTDNVGVTGYRVYRNGTLVASLATTNYTDSQLAVNTAYSYTVSAVDAAGNMSERSTALVVATQPLPDTAAPSAPTNARATASSSNKVAVIWTASTDNVGVTGYYVQRDGATIAVVTGTNYTDTTVGANTTYNYVIKARDAAGNVSTASNKATVTTPNPPDTTAPTAPDNLTASAVSATQINLSWHTSTDNTSVNGYRIYRNGTQIGTSQTTSYGDTNLTANTIYAYTVYAYDAADNVSAASAEVSATTLDVAGGITGSRGMWAEYFSGTSLNGAATVSRQESTVNYTWGEAGPAAGVSADNFSARWTGRVIVPKTGTYTFYAGSDDGARLWVNNKLLIDDWKEHAFKQNKATIRFKSGDRPNIKLEYFERNGDAAVKLLWSGPNVSKQVIPKSALLPQRYGLTGTYYSGGSALSNFSFQRLDKNINFNWASKSPSSGLLADNFSVRWTGQVYVPKTGKYTFYTSSDDGVRLWVNGQRLVNDWRDHSTRTNKGILSLTGGRKQNIVLEYYENKGLADAKLLWSGPSISKQIINNKFLYDRW